MFQITVKMLKQEIKEQKKQALNGTVHVISDPASASAVNASISKYNGIMQNPTQIVNHQIPAGAPPAKVVQELARCFPRLLIVAVCNTSDRAIDKWVKTDFIALRNKVPAADVRFIDVKLGMDDEEKAFLESHNANFNPTILVYKMGHLLDTFAVNAKVGSSASAQLEERDAAIRAALESRKETERVDIDAILRRGYDKGYDAYEERERQRKIVEARKEAESKRLEKIRVKQMIEQQRSQRAKK